MKTGKTKARFVMKVKEPEGKQVYINAARMGLELNAVSTQELPHRKFVIIWTMIVMVILMKTGKTKVKFVMWGLVGVNGRAYLNVLRTKRAFSVVLRQENPKKRCVMAWTTIVTAKQMKTGRKWAKCVKMARAKGCATEKLYGLRRGGE